MYPQLAQVILPYTRLELPGWGHLFRWFKVSEISNYALWQSAPTKTVRGKWHGYRMKLHLSNWSERYTYFLGRFYDLNLQLVMNQVLQPGDRFIDIGANIGMLTLHAAALVTSAGRVDSFEPNPRCCQRIQEALKANDIDHVQVHQAGLADQRDTLTLSVITDHTGMGTLAAPREADQHLVSDSFQVPVQVGDEVVLSHDQPVKLIKIDVEGFELRVLRGLRKTLQTWTPIVSTEVAEAWLNRAGTSRQELIEFMRQLGYSPYCLSTRRHFVRHRLSLIPVSDAAPASHYNDFLWLHPNSRGTEQLKPFIAEPTG